MAAQGQPDYPGSEPGHPEHREYWGAGGARAQPGAAFGQPGHPGDAESTGEWSAWTDRGVQPPAAGERRYVPGPRPEYVHAFDAAPAWRPAAAADAAPESGPRSGPTPVPPVVGAEADAEPDAEPETGTGTETETDGAADEDQPKKRGSTGRTCTGVVAAAVTTVLAVVVAGQVADGRSLRAGWAKGSGGERDASAASRSNSKGRPAPARGPVEAAPVSLHDQLKGRFPLAADLALGGSFGTVGGADKAPGKGQVIRYRVDVEKGLPLDGELFARLVHETLNDRRSWGHGGVRTFERVSSGHADWVITLASPGTTDVWCAKSGLDTSEDKVSCDSASTERVMINAYRWAQGAETYGDDMLGYRRMLINHEVGHRLGHGHVGCPADGALAPVMMQQTKFLATDGATCKPNPWPFP